MRKLTKIIKTRMDIFVENTFLRNILILSILTVIIYPILNINILYPIMTRSTIINIKNEAQGLAFDMALELGLSKMELGRDGIQGDFLMQVKHLEKKLLEKKPNVTKLRIYSRSGETLYSSSTREIGESGRGEFIAGIISRGVAQTNLLRKDVRLSGGKTTTVYFVETTVPIMRNNKFVGALETYYDVTSKIQSLESLVGRFSTSLYVIGFGLMSTVVLMAFKMAKTEESLRESKKEVHHSKQHLERLIESSTDAIITTDRAGKVVLFNKGAEDLSGFGREDVIGRRSPVLYENEEDAKEVMRRMREDGGTISAFETTFRAKDGTIIPVLTSASILYDEDAQEAGTVGFSKDLRELKGAEDELRKRHEELRQAYDALERVQASAVAAAKLAAVGRLTAGVSHEILNPLNVIMLRLHAMISDPDTPSGVLHYLRILEKHANRIAKITRDLLSFSRQREPERRRLDLGETAERTLGLLERDLRLENIEVDLKLEERLPSVLADLDQIQQVVLNLLTNARDAMPGGGRLILSTEAILTDENQCVELRVEDTGEGIAPEHLDKLFDPFFTTKGEGEGTGLGLSICQGIVEAHGGSIWAENVPGGGAAFVVRLGVEERKDS